MLDDLFLNDNLRTLQDAAMRPPPVPKQAAGFSAWRTATALPRGVVAGGVQAGSGMADVLGAFGETLGATGTASSRGMFSVPTADERQQADAAAKKLREQGASFDLGDPGRRFADEFKPDPETAHTAERLVFDFARVASKAVGYVATTGGLPGALMTGADEGLTVADELKQQGVDLKTRAKVGAVVGGVTALGVGLPMAGNTLAQTAGLVALGGPVSFMAQQQAVRSILEAADYTKLAEQYDPLDPVGLAVSTLIPAGFGAWGLRAARARQAREATEAAARAEAEFAAGPVPSERTAVANAVRAVTDEQVDAARVMLAVERRQAASPFRSDDWRAFDAHEQAMVRAAEQMARGERVAVADALPPVIETPEAQAARVQIDALQAEREQLLPVAEQLAERGTIREARRELAMMEQERPNISDEAARDLAKQIQAKDRVSYKAALSEARKQLEGQQVEFLARQQRLNQAIEANAAAQRATQRLGELDKRIADLEASLPAESRLPRFGQQLQRLGRQINPTQEPPRAPAAPARPAPEATPPAADPPPADARGTGPEQQPTRPDAATGGAATAEARLVDDATARQADALLAEQPDMLVMLDGMDAPRITDTPPVDLPSAAARQIADAISEAKASDPFAEYALRVIPGEFRGELRRGDSLPPSRQWVDGQMTDEELAGTSAARINGETPEQVLEAIKLLGAHGDNGPNGYYFGDRVVLVKGERADFGEDVGEVLISDAEVVGVWRKRGMGKEPITPNELSSPSPLGDFAARLAEAGSALDAALPRPKEPPPNAPTRPADSPAKAPTETEAPAPATAGRAEPARPVIKEPGTAATAATRLVDDATARQADAPRFEADPFATTRLVLPEAADVADQLRGMGEGAFWAVEGGRLLRSGTDTPGDGGMGGEVVGRTSWVPAEEWFGRMRNDMGASGLSNQKEIKAAIEKAIEGQPLNAKERRTIDWMRGEIRDMEAKLWELDDADQAAVDAFSHGLSSRDAGDFALTARAAEIDADAVERAAIRFENDDAGFMAEMRRIADEQDGQPARAADQPGAGSGARGAATADPPPADARGTGPEQQPTRPDAATGGAATAEARLVDDATARQADALLAEQPDMLVMLDGMDAPRRLSEVLADIKAEADEMRLDGELLQVAAQCALQNGA